MIVVGLGIGLFFVVLGFMYATERVELHWAKGKAVQRREIPPFIWSETQCRKCGKAGDLLSLDEKLCVYCHDRVHSG